MDKGHQKAMEELRAIHIDIEKAISKANAADCQKLQAKLMAALEKHRLAAEGDAGTLQSCFQDCERFLEQVQPDIDRIVIQSERTDLVNKVKPLVAKISAAIEKNDGEAILKLWKEMQAKMQPLLEDATGAQRFSEHPDVVLLLSTHQQYAGELESTAEVMINHKAAIETIKKCAKVVADMKAYLIKEDGESALKQWRSLKDCAKPLIATDGQQKYGEFEEVQQFVEQYNVMEETIEKECDRLIRLKVARSIIKKGQAVIADMEKAMAKGDGPSLKKSYAILIELSNPLTEDPEANYSEFQEVKDYLKQLAEYQDSDAKGDALIIHKAMDDTLTRSEKLYKELQTAISDKDGEAAKKKWTLLQEAVKPFIIDPEQKFAEFAQVEAFLEMYSELSKTIEADSTSLINLKFAQGIIAKCAKLSQEIEGFEKKADGDGMLRVWKKLVDTAQPLLCDPEDTYSGFEEVAAFKTKFETDQPQVNAAGERLQRLKQAQAILKPLKTLMDSIQKGLANANTKETSIWSIGYWKGPTDGEAINKLWAQLKEKAAPVLTEEFSERYAEFEEVQAFLTEYNDLSGRVEGEAEALIREKEGKRIHSICVKLLEETKVALSKSQGDAAKKAWDKLWETSKPLMQDNGRFDALNYVQDIKSQIKELKDSNVEETIRVMINKNNAMIVIAKCLPLIEKVDKAIAEGKSADAKKHFKALESTVWVLIQDVGHKYGSFEEVIKIKAEWDRVRAKVEGRPVGRAPKSVPSPGAAISQLSTTSITTANTAPVSASDEPSPPAPDLQTKPDIPLQKPVSKVTQLFRDRDDDDDDGSDADSGPQSTLQTNEPADILKQQLFEKSEGNSKQLQGGAVDKNKPLFSHLPQDKERRPVSAADLLKQQLLQMPQEEEEDDDTIAASKATEQTKANPQAVSGASAGTAAKKSALFDSDSDVEAEAAITADPVSKLPKAAHMFDSDNEAPPGLKSSPTADQSKNGGAKPPTKKISQFDSDDDGEAQTPPGP